MKGSSRSFGCARSTLLISSTIGRPTCFSSSSTRSSSSVQRSASTTNRFTSDVRQRRDRGAVHVAVHRARLLRVDARQVDEHDLHPGLVQHAVDARARRLRLRADDADLLPDQRVQQRGLADVRTARERGKAAANRRLCTGGRNDRFVCHDFSCARPRASSTRCAASCSARRRLEPLPVARNARSTAVATRDEPLFVRFAAHFFQRVFRQRESARLQFFLQSRLGILERLGRGQFAQALAEQPVHHVTGGLDAAVEVDRAENRLEAVRQDGIAAEAARLQFAAAESQLVAEVEFAADRRERRTAHERGAEPAEVAFGGVRERAEREQRDREVEDRVAEEFEALVVRAAGAAVGQRCLEQPGITKAIPEPPCGPFIGVQQGPPSLWDGDRLVELDQQVHVRDERLLGLVATRSCRSLRRSCRSRSPSSRCC